MSTLSPDSCCREETSSYLTIHAQYHHLSIVLQVAGVKPRKVSADTQSVPLSTLIMPGAESTEQPSIQADAPAGMPPAAAAPGHRTPPAAAGTVTPPEYIPWSPQQDAHIAAAVKAFAREKKQAAAHGLPAPKISWTRVAAQAPLQPGQPALNKAQVKARFAQLKASGALKKSAAQAVQPKPAQAASVETQPTQAGQAHVALTSNGFPPTGAAESLPASTAPSWPAAQSSPENVMAAMLARHAGGTHVLGGGAAPLKPDLGGFAPSFNQPATDLPTSGSVPPAEGGRGKAAPPPNVAAKGGLLEEDLAEEDFDDDDDTATGGAFVTRALAPAAAGGGSPADTGGGGAGVHLPTGVSTAQLVAAGGEMIQPAVAQGLRELLFGVPDAAAGGARALRCLDAKWLKQGVQMDPHDGMRFGIVQHEGGPCGALAALQATTLKHLYFRDTPLSASAPPNPQVWELILQGIASKEGAHRSMQFAALAGRKGTVSSLAVPIPDAAWGDPPAHALALAVLQAFGDIVWRCAQQGSSGNTTAVLALPCSDMSVVGGGGMTRRAPPLTSTEGGGSLTIRSDGLTERLVLLPCDSRAALDAALSKYAGVLLRPHAPTAVCLVYSAALSRGLGLPTSAQDALRGAGHALNAACSGGLTGGVLGDMDTGLGSEAKLIGAHNYATQELVNLLLTGTASSNVHDGELKLGEGGDATVLRGVASRSDIGFLTLFEHYGYMAVGEHYKQPRSPVWVVCSESHYSTLFALPPVAVGRLSPEAWWKALGVQGGVSGDELELQGVNFIGQRATTSTVSEGATGRVDLAYYDGLDKQEEPIHFTLHVEGGAHSGAAATPVAGPKVVTAFTALGKGHRGGDDMDTPPLDMVLRTRWPAAQVEWNATEPLL